jgi:hypothetical protein
MRQPRADTEDRGPYRARCVGPNEECRGQEGTLYRDEYNDGLFEVNDELLPDENWSFDDDADRNGVICGLDHVELLDEDGEGPRSYVMPI